MPSAYSIPAIYEQEIEAVIDAGYYSNKSEVVRDALRTLFEQKHQLRLAAAVELYKSERVTLSKAAELADMSSTEFKDILKDRKIKVVVPKESKQVIRGGVDLIRKSRQ